MKKSINITTQEQLQEMYKNMKSNGISIYVVNQRELYCRLEALCKCCIKHFKKHNGLDLDYLTNSSTMKAITREARKQLLNYDEQHTMQEDAEARKTLALYVYEYCKAEMKTFNEHEFIRTIYLKSTPAIDIDIADEIDCTKHTIPTHEYEQILQKFEVKPNSDMMLSCNMWMLNKGPQLIP